MWANNLQHVRGLTLSFKIQREVVGKIQHFVRRKLSLVRPEFLNPCVECCLHAPPQGILALILVLLHVSSKACAMGLQGHCSMPKRISRAIWLRYDIDDNCCTKLKLLSKKQSGFAPTSLQDEAHPVPVKVWLPSFHH